jgi:hypothetical protein
MCAERRIVELQSWLQAQANWREEPGLWLAGSLLAYVLAANLAWLVVRQKGTLGRWAARLQAWPGTTWLVALLRWVFFVAPPYGALLLGIISPRSLGWAEIDWVHGAGVGGITGAAALVLLCLGWWSYRRGLPSQQDVVEVPLSVRPVGWLATVVEAAALQLHWAFYRSAALTVTWPDRPQWWNWIGLALIGLEWALNPWLWRRLNTPSQAEPIYRRAILALVTTAFFILTGNFWLCWALHALFELGAQAIGGQKQKQTRSQPSG